MGKIGIIYSHRYLDHITGTHVENAGRVTAIREALLNEPWADSLEWLEPRAAAPDDIAMIHDRDYIRYIRNACKGAHGTTFLNPDTAVSSESYEVALLAAGGVFEGIDRVVAGAVDGFFAMVRPPGHHAERADALGFCLFNNIAIGARYAQENHGISRVFILDWDVHHGNGTQHSFEEDPSVFFCSFHQYPHYPGTGGRAEMGRDDGLGYTMNFPMHAGSGNDDYMYLVEECVGPAIQRFEPELLLISAGYDAHRSDPLGGIMLTEEGYGAIFDYARSCLPPGCRVGLVLEGGYDYNALSSSAAQVVGTFTGDLPITYISDMKSPGGQAVDLARYVEENHPILKHL